jgi:hypothetical protein
MMPLIVAMLVLSSFTARAGEGLVSEAEGDRLYRAQWDAQKTGICNVHHIAMEKKRVRIAWGLFDYDRVYSSAEIRHFPNAQEYIMGGCVVDEKKAGERVSIYVCPACQRAKADWLAHHRKPQGDS